jgi:carbamoyltransferase
MNILGINYSNDAAASLVRDGAVIAACQEERFRRSKHYAGFPQLAVDYCLREGAIEFADLDAVAVFWNPGIHAEAFYRGSAARRHHLEFLYSVPNYLLTGWNDGESVVGMRQVLELSGGRDLTIEYCTHHEAHIASTFYRSNFEESAVLTVDGYGERSSTTISKARGTSYETLLTVEFPHSLGSLYAAFTQFLGFRANNGEGKVMGLAGYGADSPYVQQVRDLVNLRDDGFELDLSVFSFFTESRRRFNPKFESIFGPERGSDEPLEQRHYDIAFALQTVTEEALIHLARLARERTGSKRLCMAGGVVLNCVANTRIQREAGFEECFFQPASNDAGTSMGAALHVAHKLGAPRVTHPLTDYLGPSFDSEQIAEVLKRGNVAGDRVQNPSGAAARALADGQIIGWFQGRAEFGPRSLGNRSILADPRREDMKDVLNARVKFREPFRPFAPSITVEAADTYFETGGVPSPFMLLVYDTRKEHRDTLPSITHVDGGARVQTVSSEQNPRYHALISRFGDLTGVPCVLNTSFNIRGEPIVNSPSDALKCFYTTDMDVLFLGDYLVTKDADKRALYATAG